jgi:predicted nucleotidyltransferase
MSERRSCLVLLDGLDEIGDEHRREQLIASLREFIEQYPRNRYVVTSRLVGFDPLPWRSLGFVDFRILGYGARQLGEFAKKWAKVLAGDDEHSEEGVQASMEAAIFSNPRVRALATNPLILTILVLLNESRGGVLPRRRVDLYAKIVDVFIETWESSKRAPDKFEETFNIDLDAREFRWLLSDLSLAMQKADRTLAPRWWIADRVRDYLQQKMGFQSEEAKDASDRIIRYLAERTGLIEERGLEAFAFSHRTLQEYFASLGVLDEADSSVSRSVPESLRGYYFHPQWSEVIRLVAAQLTPPIAESLLRCIVDDPDPVGRFLKRGPLLALRCLSDGATVPNRQFITNVFNSLADLGRSRWVGITLEAFNVLDSFGGTRLEPLAKETLASILQTAEGELVPEDYAALHERAHFAALVEALDSRLGPEFESEAVRDLTITIGGHSCRIVNFNVALRLQNPTAWHRAVGSLLQDEAKADEVKEMLVREMGRHMVTDPRSRRTLRKILASPGSSTLRAACARALASGTKGHDDVKLLLRTLQRESDEEVRAACAAALKNAAACEVSVRGQLIRIIEEESSIAVRAGAARGLSKAALKDSSLADALFRHATQKHTPDELRIACARALEGQIGRNDAVTEAFQGWLDAEQVSGLQRTAALAIARAEEEDRLPWDPPLVARVERLLMALEDPCPCALAALEALATIREVRRGLRFESVLWEAMKPLADRVELAFVFGSTARRRQSEGSDIDLLMIGDVRLKDLSVPLRDAERTLGRRISPALYTRAAFRERYQTGDPFLIDVCRREKIPVIPSGASRQELDDELRAMVAERLDPAG